MQEFLSSPNWSEKWGILMEKLVAINSPYFKLRKYDIDNKSYCYVLAFDGVSILFHLFTPDEHKKKGYATQLIKKVIREERSLQESNILLARTLNDYYVETMFLNCGFEVINKHSHRQNVILMYDLK